MRSYESLCRLLPVQWKMSHEGWFDYDQTFVENPCTYCDDVHRAILVLLPTILALGIVAITWRCPPQWCSLKLLCVAYFQPLTKARTMSAHLPKSLLYFKVSHWRQLANQDVLYAPKSTSIPLLQRAKTIYYLKNPKFIQLSDSAFHMYAVHLVH